MSVTGNFAELDAFAKNLARLDSLPSQIASDSAEGIKELIDRQFDKGTDPYGTAWAPLKDGRPSHLEESSDLRDSINVKPQSGAGISITCDSPYAEFHQNGTSRMPARPIFPTGEMPASWQEVMADAGQRAFERRMGGR